MKIYLNDIYTIYKEDILQIAHEFGVGDVRVFGSILKGWVEGDSDIDFLVNMADETNWKAQIEFELALQALLSCKVDILTELNLPKLIREKVVAEAINIQSPRDSTWTGKNLMLYIVSIEHSMERLSQSMLDIKFDQFISNEILISSCRYHMDKILRMIGKLLKYGQFTQLESYKPPLIQGYGIDSEINLKIIYHYLSTEINELKKIVPNIRSKINQSKQ